MSNSPDRRRSPERKRAVDAPTPSARRQRIAIENFQERATNPVVVTIDPSCDHGIWEGWGISLCWWAAMRWKTPSPDVIADLTFTLEPNIKFQTTSSGTYQLPGLGMNMVRYNAGASGPGMKPTLMKDTRKMEGFWDEEHNNPDEWDWRRDRQQIQMLQEAKKRGANLFELFSNSPLWWMCHTKNPSGSLSGIKDNLMPQHYANFARYLVEVAAHAHKAWHIDFEYIAPFNEPSSIWWSMSNPSGQEGCHFEHIAQAKLVKVMNEVLIEEASKAKDEGLKVVLNNLKIAASDENTYDQAIDTWDSLDHDARETIKKINVHGYQKGDGLRHELHKRAFAGMKRVWTSEYGDSDETGTMMIKSLILDFNHLHPTAWAYWQVLDSGGWGLVQANAEDNWVGRPNAKLFVLAHYSRHIRPGMRILNVKNGRHELNTVAAFSDAEERLVLVTANQAHASRLIRYDLSHFQAKTNSVEVRWWSTDIDVASVTCGKSTEKPTAYIERPKFELKDSELQTCLEAWFDFNTIQTFEISGIEPKVRSPTT